MGKTFHGPSRTVCSGALFMGRPIGGPDHIESKLRCGLIRQGVPDLSKPELGTKRDCPSCGAKFYDLTKSPAVCPKCKHEFVPDQGTKAKRAKPVEKPKEKAPVRPKKRVEEDEDGDVSLDAMRDEELADDDSDDDLLAGITDDVDDDDDSDDDAFLPDDDDDDDDVSSIVRGGSNDDE
tara:strand:+ start:298320 stop:298856 length:537 start_codon:yes stop_codon:yes gene_type:complete